MGRVFSEKIMNVNHYHYRPLSPSPLVPPIYRHHHNERKDEVTLNFVTITITFINVTIDSTILSSPGEGMRAGSRGGSVVLCNAAAGP